MTNMSPADLVKAAFLFATSDMLAKIELESDKTIEREKIVIKSGQNAGQVIFRRPRLQVILPYKMNLLALKKALTFAVSAETFQTSSPKPETQVNQPQARYEKRIPLELLPKIPDSISTIQDALHLFGFPPNAMINKEDCRNQYTNLLKQFHPDTGGDNACSIRTEFLQQAWKIVEANFE
ncbi:MAG: J domain-containing protein [Alphaproteobacteria bacterium]